MSTYRANSLRDSTTLTAMSRGVAPDTSPKISRDMTHDMVSGPPAAAESMLYCFGNDQAAAFQREILTFRHRLAESGLFTDEALVDLLARHPSDKLDVCTMSDHDPEKPNKFMTGDFRDTPPAILLEAARSGAVWINAREAMNIHEDYARELARIYGELAELTGNTAFNPRGGILISSPIARVPYHVDKTETILWHVRGEKRIYIYPCTQAFIPDASYEATLTSIIEDDLPYDASFDADAKVFDLDEGQAITWPLNSPHRVDNRSFCVSVTTEYSTVESGRKNAAMLTNAVLRSRLGLDPSFARDGALVRRTKSVVGRALKKVGMVPDTSRPDMVGFRIDPEVDGYVVPTEPYLRDF